MYFSRKFLTTIFAINTLMHSAQPAQSNLEIAEQACAIGRGVFAAGAAACSDQDSKKTKLLLIAANAARIGNSVTSLFNRPNDYAHYNYFVSAISLSFLVRDLLSLKPSTEQDFFEEEYDEELSEELEEEVDLDLEEKVNYLLQSLKVVVLPVIETGTALYSARDHGVTKQDQLKRLKIQGLCSLVTMLSLYSTTKSQTLSEKLMLVAILANIAVLGYDFTRKPLTKPDDIIPEKKLPLTNKNGQGLKLECLLCSDDKNNGMKLSCCGADVCADCVIKCKTTKTAPVEMITDITDPDKGPKITDAKSLKEIQDRPKLVETQTAKLDYDKCPFCKKDWID